MMLVTLTRLLTILLIFTASFAQAPQRAPVARPVARPAAQNAETLSPGIEHVTIKRGDFSKDGGDRWTIHAIIADAKLSRLRLAQAKDEVVGAEATSSMAARHKALAAINGGYFRTTGPARGEPIGALTIRGKVLSEPVRNRAALAVRDDGQRVRAAVTHTTVAATLTADGKASRPINGINRPREKGELILFTPEFHRTTLTEDEGIEAVIARNRVTAAQDGAGDQTIPRGGVVISASGSARQWVRAHLRRGTPVEIKIKTRTEPPLSFTPDFILGGGPQLIAAGRKVFAAESSRYGDSLYKQRHPRTAIGWRTDGKLILVVVDGRQKSSAGMTMDELATLMLELNCIEAMNLDGGGSTTMVIRNRIVNSPSDLIGERAVSDALMIFAR
ncbi:MAG: phosphodiester glycosidase family protein [Acidobacteriota bacterium]